VRRLTAALALVVALGPTASPAAQALEPTADVFQELTQGLGGDPAKMTEALARGSTDPSGLAAALSPRTLERLRQLSIKISDQRR